ncbi:MAG: hypothetical protein MJ091_07120 [Clostridia bacterium]|nr:hypothetical protein [Clostridia bacterium]
MPITMIDRFPLAMDKKDLQYRYGILNECIEDIKARQNKSPARKALQGD